MPAHPMLHAFGALLIYRQQETGLQCKPGSRRSSCPQSRTTRTARKHLRLGHGPQERTGADRQQRPNRTKHDHAGLDIKSGTIIDPNFLQFKLNVESTVEPSVKEVLKYSQPRRYLQRTPRRYSTSGTSASSAHASTTSESSA